MAKRKLSDEPDRMFVHKTQRSEVTETIHLKIQDFTEKIDDLVNKKKKIESPMFTMAGKELCVKVFPEDWNENTGKFISVFLTNLTKEDITATVNFKSSSAPGNLSMSLKNDVIKAGLGRGFGRFLSHETFKKWARENEDIFSLEVEVTLHVKGAPTWVTER